MSRRVRRVSGVLSFLDRAGCPVLGPQKQVQSGSTAALCLGELIESRFDADEVLIS